MKKIYLLLCVVLCSTVSFGQLLTENFSYTAGQLITANGWTAHSGGGTNAITVTAPSLTYTNHPGSGVGNAISMTTSGEDDNKGFTAITTGSAYASFLVNVSAAQATGDYFIGLLLNNTTFPLRVYAKSSGAGFVFGISKSNGAITYDGTVRTFGTTYLIVTKYVYNAGVNDDAVSLWVDPALGGAETAATIANVTGAVADATTLIAFFVRQGTAGSASTQRVDAILVGTTWAEVTPTVGGTPNVIVTPTSLTGFSALVSVASGEQTYDVSATDLTGNLVITPPAGFEISQTTGPFTPENPITFVPVSGVVTTKTIHVRMLSATLGLNTGNITNVSSGSNSPSVSVTGHVLAAEPTTQGVISIGTVTNSTIDVTFTAGDGAKQILVIHALTAVTSTPADGTTYTANTIYGSGANLGANTYVVYNGVSGNGGGTVTITGLAIGTQYHLALFEYNDAGVAGAENYLISPLSPANATTLSTVNTYIWSGAVDNTWTNPLNWIPDRLFPATNDSLLFFGPLTATVTGVPAQSIGYLGVSLAAKITLQAAVATTTLNIGNSSGFDLEVEGGSQLNISGANGYTINMVTGTIAVIDGDMTFSGGAHRLTAVDAGSVNFNGSFSTGVGFTGGPFGAAGTTGSVVFTTGSVMNQASGSNPFQTAGGLVAFQTGSLYRITNAGFTPSYSGRTYADVEIDAVGYSVNSVGGSPLSIDNLTVTNGIQNLNLTGGISIKGNISIAAGATLGFNPATLSTLTLDGASAQSITNGGTLTWGALESLTINNTAGVTLNSDITLGATTTLALTNGILKLDAPATMITLSSGTALTGGNSNASYVDGKVKKIGNTAFTFPVGKTGTGYVPIGLSTFIAGDATSEFTAEYIRNTAASVSILITAPFIDHLSHCDYWTLVQTGGTAATADVTAYWSTNNGTGCGTTYIDDLTKLELVNFGGVSWSSSSAGVHFINGTVTAGDITWTGGVSTFGPFSLGSTDAVLNPLPITINYFNGTKQSGNHLLNWKVTCTNMPSVTMELQRSSDAGTYTGIYTITATALQCQQPFSHIDNQPLGGVNYYRLKMTDANGRVTYSSIVPLINADKGIDVMNIAPNPIVGGNFKLNVSAAQKAQLEIVITDMQGRLMQKQATSAIAGFNTIPVNVASFAKGTYQLFVNTAEGRSRVLRFVVQ